MPFGGSHKIDLLHFFCCDAVLRCPGRPSNALAPNSRGWPQTCNALTAGSICNTACNNNATGVGYTAVCAIASGAATWSITGSCTGTAHMSTHSCRPACSANCTRVLNSASGGVICDLSVHVSWKVHDVHVFSARSESFGVQHYRLVPALQHTPMHYICLQCARMVLFPVNNTMRYENHPFEHF